MSKDKYYTFIRPRNLMPREPQVAIGGADAKACINWLVQQSPESVHYDLETTGLSYNDPNRIITNVGLACEDWVIGIDLLDVPFEDQQVLWDWLGKQNLGGFNLSFDLAWPWRDETGMSDLSNIKVVSDTSLWFRVLATESHPGQTHNLEALVSTVLGWPEEYQQKGWLKYALEKHQLKKDLMWKLALLEPHEYTVYCALDAEASFQAHRVFQETVKDWGFDGLNQYHDRVLVSNIKRAIKSTCVGIPIDREKILRNTEWVNKRLMLLEAQALNHPDMQPTMEEWTRSRLEQQHTLNCHLKKIWAKASDEPWKYPEIYRIHHVANPEKLPKWCREFGGKFYKPETQFAISNMKKEWPRFNVSSPADMKWLIYDHWLEGKYDVWYRNPENKAAGGLLTVHRNGKEYQLTLTPGGGLPIGGEILTLFGEIGTILNEYKALKKLLSDFLEKYELASRRDGAVHAHSKILGTVTGRASGGN